MRRAGFTALVALIATVPAWADVNITAVQVGDTNEVIISFDARSETNPVRLDVRPDNKSNIAEVTDNNDPIKCMKETHPGYADWVEWGEPICWCYAKQCRGDINGSSFFGKPITISDINLFKQAFNKTDAELALIPNGICADVNHSAFFGKRATIGDLNVFKLFFGQVEAEIPMCDSTHYNFWETP